MDQMDVLSVTGYSGAAQSRSIQSIKSIPVHLLGAILIAATRGPPGAGYTE